MPKGITRAQDRVAFWVSAADDALWDDGDQQAVSPPTSQSPSGATPEPAAPAISKSKKFLQPANALKKLLDNTEPTATSVQMDMPEGTHSGIKNFFDAKPDFTKTYIKPDYADMLKAHLGDENFDKLIYHMPEEHHQALTTHEQKPAPKSKKWSVPANQLKKILDDPHTETTHVTDWLQGPGSAFAQSYLKPSYDDALKAHLGEQKYHELQQHLNPHNQPQQPSEPAQYEPETEHDEAGHEGNLTDIANDMMAYGTDPQAPSYQAWEQTLSPQAAAHFSQNPTDAANAYDEYLSNNKHLDAGYFDDKGPQVHGDDDDDLDSLPPSNYWDDFEANDDPDELQPYDPQQFLQNISNTSHDHDAFHTLDFEDWWDSQSPDVQHAYMQDPHAAHEDYLDWQNEEPDETDDDDDQDHINAIQDLLQPVHQQQGEPQDWEIAHGIKKIFPNAPNDINNMSTPQLKAQLESWLKYLPDHEGYAAHVPQLQALYDQYFGDKSQEEPGWHDEVPASLGEGWYDFYPGGNGWHPYEHSLEENKAHLEQTMAALQKNPIGAAALKHVQGLYDQHFGEGGQSEQPAAPAKSFGDAWKETMGTPGYPMEHYLKEQLGPGGEYEGDAQAQALYDQYFGDQGAQQQHPQYQQFLDKVPPTSEAGKAIHSPQFKQWFHQLPPDQQSGALAMPVAAYKTFLKSDAGQQYQQDALQAEPQQLKTKGIGQDYPNQAPVAPDAYPGASFAGAGKTFWDNVPSGFLDWQDGESEGPQPGVAAFLESKGYGPDELTALPYNSTDQISQVSLMHDWDALPDVGKQMFADQEKEGQTGGQQQPQGTIPVHPNANQIQPIEWKDRGFQNWLAAQHPDDQHNYTKNPLDAVQDWALEKEEYPQHFDAAGNYLKNNQPSGPAPFDPATFGKDMQAADPSTFDDEWAQEVADGKIYSSPEYAKKHLEQLMKGPWPPEEKAAYQKVFDKYFGDGTQATPSAGPPPALSSDQAQQMYDISNYSAVGSHPNFTEVDPESFASYPPEKQKQVFQQLIQEHQESGYDSQAHELQALYNQIYGQSGGASAPPPQLTADQINKIYNLSDTSKLYDQGGEEVHPVAWPQDPAAQQQLFKKLIDWHQNYDGGQYADKVPELQKLYDQIYGSSSSGFHAPTLAQELAGIFGSSADKIKVNGQPVKDMTPEQAATGLANLLNIWKGGPEGDKVQALYDKYFGQGAGGQQGSGDSYEQDWKKFAPSATQPPSQEELEKLINSGVYEGSQLAEMKAIYDKHFGNGQQSSGPQYDPSKSPAELGLTLDKLKELGFNDTMASTVAHWSASGLASNMESIKNNGGSDYGAGNPDLQAWGNLYQHLTQGGQGGQQEAPPFDPDQFAQDLEKAAPGVFQIEYSEWKTPETAKNLLQKKLDSVFHNDKPYTPALQQVYDKWFGSGGGSGASGGAQQPLTAETWKNIFPGFSGWFSHKLDGKSPDEQIAILQDYANGDHSKLAYGAAKALTEHFGIPTKAAYNPSVAFADYKKVYPSSKIQSTFADQALAKAFMEKKLQSKALSDGQKQQLQALYDKHFGGPQGATPQPVKPAFDWDKFGPTWMALYPNSSWGKSPHSEQEAEAKLKTSVEFANEHFPDTEKTQKVNELYQKWFPGGSVPGAPATPAAAPPPTASKSYQHLLDRAENLKHLFSDKDRQTLKSPEFKKWYDKAPAAYRAYIQNNPGSALDDFDKGQYAPVPEGFATQKKPSPNQANPFIQNMPAGTPKAFQYNKPRGNFVDFPVKPDEQETLPGLDAGPTYEHLPIYRVLNLNLDHKPDADRAPANVKAQGPKAVKLWVHQQTARLRRIDQILNGDKAGRDPEHELQQLKSWGSQYGLSNKEVNDLASVLFSEQGDLFGDDPKWQHLKELGQKHPDIDMDELHDLAAKLDVMPPSGSKGSYDHPELGQLILDYLENTAHRSSEGGAKSEGGLGWHWTRAVNKAYKGVPAAGVGKSEMKATDRQVPIAISGLWTGQGEGAGHGGAYEPDHSGELEHNLLSHAPVHVRRVQIRAPGPENQGYGAWHDVIDHGPISLWGRGRYEEGDEGHSYDYAPDPMVKFKPSLGHELNKLIPGYHDPELFDNLKPGHKTDQIFSQLIGQNPDRKDQLLTLYRDFFVGRPDLPTKPHVRRASLQKVVADPHDLDPRNPTHLVELAKGWGIANPERYGLPYLKELARDLKGVGFAWKAQVKQHGLGRPVARENLAALEAQIQRLADYYDSDYDEDLDDLKYIQEEDEHGYDPDDWENPPGPAEGEWETAKRPLLPGDSTGRRYFSPHKENPESTSGARPWTEWADAEHEQDPLPFPDRGETGGFDRFQEKFTRPTDPHFIDWVQQHYGFDPSHPDFKGTPPEGGLFRDPFQGNSSHDYRGIVNQYNARNPQFQWPKDRQSNPLWRGFTLDLRHPELGEVRRALHGPTFEGDYGQHDSQGNGPMSNKALAQAHPLGYDNPALSEKILDFLDRHGRDYGGQNQFGLGPHWTTSENQADQFAFQTSNGAGHGPLVLPVKVRSQWKGLGEDPYRTHTLGDWHDEQEITMLPSTKMHVDSVQIHSPEHHDGGQWHETLPEPTQRHAQTTVRRPRGILTHAERRL